MDPRYAPYPPVPQGAPQARAPRMNKAQIQTRVRILKRRVILGSVVTFAALTGIITLRTFHINPLAGLTTSDQNQQQNQGGGFFQQGGQNGGLSGGNGSNPVTGSGGS
jgi:hypothetical protein